MASAALSVMLAWALGTAPPTRAAATLRFRAQDRSLQCVTAWSVPEELRYAELFFHVFAHVAETARLPASVADRRYVAWCEQLLGAAEKRTLAEDARLLASEFATHGALVGVQALAKLFKSVERLTEVGERSLAQLLPSDVDDPRVLSQLQSASAGAGASAGAELAFCALLLELPSFSRLPEPAPTPPALMRRVESLVRAAPGLEQARLGCVRSLMWRGRAWGDDIWLGHPGAEVGPTVEHAAWQAAHEATVVAVGRQFPALSEREVEARAVEHLAVRAAQVGEREGHAAWLRALQRLA